MRLVILLTICCATAYAQPVVSWADVYSNRKLNDFEHVEYASPRYDVSLGGAGTAYAGHVGSTFRNGGGVGTKFMIYGANGWGGGMITEFLGQRQKQSLPSLGGFRQGIKSRTTMIGGAVGKIFNMESAHQFALQFEGAYGLTNFVAADATFGSTMELAHGFIPGITASYLVPLGQGRMMHYRYLPMAYRCFFDFHFSARQLLFNETAVQGTMYEVGVSIRVSMRAVMDYRLKDPR